MNLLTRMKSPTISVGIIDPDGIRNGSTTNERSRNTIRMTGKKLFGYSIHHGSFSPARRALAKYSRSASAIAPVTTSRRNRISAKFMPSALLSLDLQDREERLLRDLDGTDLLHPLLAGLLLLQQLALAGDIAAIALGEHVLAQRLHRLAGDDLRADGRLDRDVEHLPRDELAHPRDQLAAAVLRVLPVNHERQRVHPIAVH